MGLNLLQTPPARLLCSSFSKWALGQTEGMICGNKQLENVVYCTQTLCQPPKRTHAVFAATYVPTVKSSLLKFEIPNMNI